ncbi:MAG TPA: peptide deformylase [Blastocatellia bacterium]|nr:peptide deformylase [Blastocatellia bacterium]
MKLNIVQVGEPVLRKRARDLSPEEIRSKRIEQLIEHMKVTMREAPGVGLAAPQIGEPLQLAVIEDPPQYLEGMSDDALRERERSAIPFHVIINPQLSIIEEGPVQFFEGCLSLSGFTAIVPRARKVEVKCLNERAEPVVIRAQGWYARILQHEIDHLYGTIYIDRMNARTFMSLNNFAAHWSDKTIDEALAALNRR